MKKTNDKAYATYVFEINLCGTFIDQYMRTLKHLAFDMRMYMLKHDIFYLKGRYYRRGNTTS